MKTIRDTQLFNKLVEKPEWETLFDNNQNCLNNEVPTLQGGLDHIEVKQKGIYFHDRGMNGRCNDFVIRPEINN